MKENKERIIERYFAELFNEGRVDIIDELLHPDYVNHSPGFPQLPRGREGVPIVVKALRQAVPDLRYTIEDCVAGLIKASVFGVLIAMAGCLRGIQCGRSSAAVGAATTSAVVTGIVLIIVSDALTTVIFDLIGL